MLADPAEWELDPWSGELRDGEIWGRGALDMKGQVAASAVAIASLAREGFQPQGDVIFIAAADEEVGRRLRARLALPGASGRRARRVLASTRARATGSSSPARPFYLASTAEKMSSPFMLRVRGRSGHASMPWIADNALVKAAKLIERLGEFKPEPRLEPEVSALFEAAVGAPPEDANQVLEAARLVDPIAVELVEPLLGMTVSPTMVDRLAEAERDPGALRGDRRLPAAARARRRPRPRRSIRELLGEGDYELEWLEGQGGTRSPMEGPLWDAIASLGGRDRAGGGASRRSASPASRTATGCATRSGPSRTASSRCATWSRARDAARPLGRTSGRAWTTWSSASSSCAMRPGR